ncbi:MAG: hypothetical protein ACJATT_005761 [Myxococcota bacterium]|jgi:hypothetical protein
MGAATVGIGVVHNLIGVALGWGPLAEIVGDGLFNAVDPFPWRMAIFWFEAFGVLLMLMGATWWWMERQGLVLPRFVAVGVALIALLGAFFMPISGFYTFLPVAAVLWHRAGAVHTTTRAHPSAVMPQ